MKHELFAYAKKIGQNNFDTFDLGKEIISL